MNTILKIFKSLQVLLFLAVLLATSCTTGTSNKLPLTKMQPQNMDQLILDQKKPTMSTKSKSMVTELDIGIFATALDRPVEKQLIQNKIHSTSGINTGLSWPTDTCFLQDLNSMEKYLQPTESGRFESGGFGFVRENNTKYHEGIDLKSFRRDDTNSPIDNVLCIQDGMVVYVNDEVSKSSYGKYVIVEHIYLDIKICSLYAHLSKINDNIKRNNLIKCGQVIGVMGRTSNTFEIDKNLAHLHFEIDLQLGDHASFQSWYDEIYGPNDKNFHGKWNGLNLIGINPIPILEALNNGDGIASVLEKEPTALTTRTFSNKTPNFVKKYNKLLANEIDTTKPLVAWDIEWTWYGLPKKLTPRYTQDIKKAKNLKTIIIEYRKSTKDLAEKRNMFSIKNWLPIVGKRVSDTIEKFGL